MKFLLLGLWLTLGPRLCAAQRPSIDRFTVTQYTDENGLPQNSVKSIAPDAMGFVWLATENGLVRYDGQRFYTFDKSNAAIPSNRISFFQPSLFDTQIPKPVAPSTPPLYAVTDDWNFIKIQNGTARQDSSYSAQYRKFPALQASHTVLASGASTNFLTDWRPPLYTIAVANSSGTYYECYREKIVYYNHWTKNYETPFHTAQPWTFFTLGGRLYYLNEGGQFSRIHHNGASAILLSGDIANHLPTQRVRIELIWNQMADQALLYVDKKLYALKPNGDGLTTELLLDGFDFARRSIKTAYYNPVSKQIFLGSLIEGLYVFSPRHFETLRGEGDELANIFYSQTPLGSNYILTPTGDVLGIDPSRPQRIGRKLRAIYALNSTDKYSMLRDKHNYIWIKRGDDILQFDPTGEHLRHRWKFTDRVCTIFQDSSQRLLWIGFATKGVFTLDTDDPQAKPRFAFSVGQSEVTYLAYQQPDQLFVGTKNGLYIHHRRTHRTSLVNGTSAYHIRHIYIPTSGEVWFTTQESGFFLYRQNTLTRFPLDANHYLAASHSVFEDKRGFFWIPTNKGLFQVARQDLLAYAQGLRKERPFYLYYTKEQGFLTNEFNGGGQPGTVRLANGYVSIPSLQGLVWFMPEDISPWLPDKALLVDRITVQDTALALRGDTILLPTEVQQVQFHLTTPYPGHPYNLELAYQLTSQHESVLPKNWIRVDPLSSSIVLSTLSSGRYQLVIRKINGFGENNYTYKRLIVIVPPLWYEIWWMRLLLIALALGSLYALARVRFRQILRSNQRLETLVTQRTSQLRASEEALSRQLYVQSRLIASITHDIQSPLQFVTEVSKRMSHLLSTKNFDALYKTIDTISTTTERTNRLLKELLVYTKMKVYERPRELDWVDLHELIASKQEVFTSLMNQKQNVFVNDVPLGLLVGSDAHLLGIILHNLLDNAVKYTIRGQIRFSASQQDGTVQLILANTGLGIPDQTVHWLNQPQNTDSTASDTQQGIGLLMVKELAALIGVGLSVKQTEITCFYLKFQACQPTS